MKFLIPLLASLALGACGSGSNSAAGNVSATTSVDAVTAEAVSDTRAATADATAAADAELDRLSNSIDDTSADKAGKADVGSGKAKVVTY